MALELGLIIDRTILAPRSELWISPASGTPGQDLSVESRQGQIPMSDHLPPRLITRRAKRSMTTARYSHP